MIANLEDRLSRADADLKFSFIDFCFPFFNQVCSIEKYKWGDHFHYKLGCAHQLVSKKISQCMRFPTMWLFDMCRHERASAAPV